MGENQCSGKLIELNNNKPLTAPSQVQELSINRFPIKVFQDSVSKTAGTFDLDAELKIWVSSEQMLSIKKQFNKSVNVYDVHKVLATHVLK